MTVAAAMPISAVAHAIEQLQLRDAQSLLLTLCADARNEEFVRQALGVSNYATNPPAPAQRSAGGGGAVLSTGYKAAAAASISYRTASPSPFLQQHNQQQAQQQRHQPQTHYTPPTCWPQAASQAQSAAASSARKRALSRTSDASPSPWFDTSNGNSNNINGLHPPGCQQLHHTGELRWSTNDLRDYDESAHGPLESHMAAAPERFWWSCCGARGDAMGCSSEAPQAQAQAQAPGHRVMVKRSRMVY